MWIRSQDKTVLCKPQFVTIEEEQNLYKIYVYTEQGLTWDVANYSTEEKALKVLDRIQTRLQIIHITDAPKVFVMPQEEEV